MTDPSSGTDAPDCPHSEAKARRIVTERAGGRCEQCASAGLTLEWAHRQNRSHGGPWCAANGLHLCSPCHRRSELNPDEAYRTGIRLKMGSDPHVHPVWLEHLFGTPGWWVLDPQGGYIAVDVTHATPRGLACRHCGQEIHIVNATRGPEWVHTDTELALCQPPTR